MFLLNILVLVIVVAASVGIISSIALVMFSENESEKNSQVMSIDSADIVFKNGAVYTVDKNNSWADAIAISDGKIIFVGTNNDAKNYISDDTQVIDLNGKMILPGFHDSHMHPLDMALALSGCNLYDLWDKELYLETIKDCVVDQEDKEWVTGMGFALPDYDSYSLNKTDLDRIVSDKPAGFMDMDGHAVWVNSKMLEVKGIDKNSQDPPGGTIVKDPNTGEPTGLFLDDAMFLIDEFALDGSDPDSYEGAKQALAMLSSGGITSFVEAMTFEGYEELFRTLDSNGELNFRVNLSLWVDSLQDRSQVEFLKEQYSNDKQSHVRANLAKLFVDQGIETQTGAVFEPYYDENGSITDNYGQLSFSSDDLKFYVTELEKAGFQIHIHAVGDKAIRQSLDAFEVSKNENNLSETRNTIAHVYLVHPDDISRFAELEVIPNYQAFWAYTAEGWFEGIESNLGTERAYSLFPFANLHDAGARISMGSDWPVTTYEPLQAIEVGMTRQDPYSDSGTVLGQEQRLDLETLIEAYTINGAYLMQQDDITGSIEVGKYADLVVLEKNLFEISPQEIGDVKVMMTMFEGKEIYRDGI